MKKYGADVPEEGRLKRRQMRKQSWRRKRKGRTPNCRQTCGETADQRRGLTDGWRGVTVAVCGLTGNGAEVEVVSDDLLVVVVHGALGEAQVEVVPQVLVNDPP